ncbi:MAG: DUF2062 domain-containing protein [Hyphomicrobiaceae bacterium]|nr:DUF2062 domain-containing protein [Hyphomicrobiaceae bacterium]
MLFKAREKPTLLRRLQLWLWPRRSFSRSATYVWKRLFRLKASPHKIAVGCAAGVFASVTPLIGVQMLMAGIIAVILRGSLPAAMLATFVGNPLSWPFIWGATYAVGAILLGSPGAAEAAALSVDGDRVWPIIYTMLIGSIPVGLFAAAVSYGLTARAIEALRGETPTWTGRGTLIASLVAARTRGRQIVRQGRATLARTRTEIRTNWAEPSWRLW